MTLTVQKWGNSLGIRIPKTIAQGAKIDKGSEVEISIAGDRIILRPAQVPSLKQLLKKVKPGSRPELIDWGKPVGKEVW